MAMKARNRDPGRMILYRIRERYSSIFSLIPGIIPFFSLDLAWILLAATVVMCSAYGYGMLSGMEIARKIVRFTSILILIASTVVIGMFVFLLVTAFGAGQFTPFGSDVSPIMNAIFALASFGVPLGIMAPLVAFWYLGRSNVRGYFSTSDEIFFPTIDKGVEFFIPPINAPETRALSMEDMEELTKLRSKLDSKELSEEEFEAQKRKIVGPEPVNSRSEFVACAHCGMAVRPDARFCDRCGARQA